MTYSDWRLGNSTCEKVPGNAENGSCIFQIEWNNAAYRIGHTVDSHRYVVHWSVPDWSHRISFESIMKLNNEHFFLNRNNAPIHQEKACSHYLTSAGLKLLEWPTYSFSGFQMLKISWRFGNMSVAYVF